MTRNDAVDSPIGPLEIESSISYWLVADFKQAKDDIVGGYVQVGRPVSVGSASVTPYLRLTQWIGLGEYPNTTLVRPGVGVSIPLSKRWSVDGDLSHVSESAFKLKTWCSELGLTRSFENGWSVTGSIKAAERMPTVYAFGFARSL